MAIIARAMKLTDLSVSLTDSEVSALLVNYTDRASVSAKESVAMCLKTGVVSGSSATVISPKDYVTRAEVAVMLQRLLKKSGLILKQNISQNKHKNAPARLNNFAGAFLCL